MATKPPTMTSFDMKLKIFLRKISEFAGATYRVVHPKINRFIQQKLVGGLNPSEKYESQLGWLFLNIGKIKFMFQTTNQKRCHTAKSQVPTGSVVILVVFNQRLQKRWVFRGDESLFRHGFCVLGDDLFGDFFFSLGIFFLKPTQRLVTVRIPSYLPSSYKDLETLSAKTFRKREQHGKTGPTRFWLCCNGKTIPMVVIFDRAQIWPIINKDCQQRLYFTGRNRNHVCHHLYSIPIMIRMMETKASFETPVCFCCFERPIKTWTT